MTLPDETMAALSDHADGLGIGLLELLTTALRQYERQHPRSMTTQDRVVILVHEGFTDGEIAAKLRTSNVHVGRLRRAAGLPPNRR